MSGVLRLLTRRMLRRLRGRLVANAILAAIAGALVNVAVLCAVGYPRLLDDARAELRAPAINMFARRDAGAAPPLRTPRSAWRHRHRGAAGAERGRHLPL